jgi:hypothetical protein
LFFPLFLFTSVILAVVSAASLNIVDQQQNTSKLVASTAAFYAAETSLEDSLYEFKINKEFDEAQHNTLIRSFYSEKEDISQHTGTLENSTYAVNIVKRSFSEVPKKLDIKKQARKFDEFRFINVKPKYIFHTLNLHFSGDDNSAVSLLIDVIYFPRLHFENNTRGYIDFGSIKDLALKTGDAHRTVKRVMYYSDKNDTAGEAGSLDFSNGTISNTDYENLITIKHFDPATFNYIVRFQVLGKNKIFYDLGAEYGGVDIDVELANQVVEVDSQTATMNMYQRVKKQQRSFAPLHPGLNFVLFSDKKISK